MKRKGVLCFIQNERKILLIQVNYGNGALIWNGVSGFIEPNETAVAAVLREVEEEIGIKLDATSLLYKGVHRVSDVLDLEVFVATAWIGEPKPQEESIVTIEWFNVDELPYSQMFQGNQDWVSALLQ